MEERGYRKLIVWKRMQELVVLVYRLTETSLLELIAQTEVCLMVGYLTEENYQLVENKKREVGYLLYRYMTALH